MNRDAVSFAQEYVDNAAGIRDEFVQTIVGIHMGAAQIYGGIAGSAVGAAGTSTRAYGDIASTEISARSSRDQTMINASMELAGVIAGIAMGSGGSTETQPGRTFIYMPGSTGGGAAPQRNVQLPEPRLT
jgi:hypothetical protein